MTYRKRKKPEEVGPFYRVSKHAGSSGKCKPKADDKPGKCISIDPSSIDPTVHEQLSDMLKDERRAVRWYRSPN